LSKYGRVSRAHVLEIVEQTGVSAADVYDVLWAVADLGYVCVIPESANG
jgi:sugar-specific transcriptional regulator TrmB